MTMLIFFVIETIQINFIVDLNIMNKVDCKIGIDFSLYSFLFII